MHHFCVSQAEWIKRARASGCDTVWAQKEVLGNADSSLPSMCARSCVCVWWALRSSTNESPWRTCQAEKWSSILGSVACRSKAYLLMWHSVSPAETSQGSSNSGRLSRAELHIPAKLLLLDAAEGLRWLWCRYLQNSQLLKSAAKLLSRWKTPVLFDHRGITEGSGDH